MRDDLIVSKSIEINVDLSTMWNVLTNPEIIKQYLFGTETVTDWKTGSEIIFRGEYNGQSYIDKGIVRENVLHKRISYTYWSSFSGVEDKPENYSLVTYDLVKQKNDCTLFTWTQKGFANEEGCNHSESGMTAFLEQLKKIAELQ